MVYVISDGSEFVKIGVAKNINSRIEALQTGNPKKLIPVKQIFFDNKTCDYLVEKALHERYEKFRVVHDGKKTEWFQENGISELLNADCEEVRLILLAQGLRFRKCEVRFTPTDSEDNVHLLFKNGFLDSITIQNLVADGYDSISAVKRWIKSGKNGIYGIGELRKQRIKEALKLWDERMENE